MGTSGLRTWSRTASENMDTIGKTNSPLSDPRRPGMLYLSDTTPPHYAVLPCAQRGASCRGVRCAACVWHGICILAASRGVCTRSQAQFVHNALSQYAQPLRIQHISQHHSATLVKLRTQIIFERALAWQRGGSERGTLRFTPILLQGWGYGQRRSAGGQEVGLLCEAFRVQTPVNQLSI